MPKQLIISPGGIPTAISAKELAATGLPPGYRVASQKEVSDFQLQAKYGGPLGTLSAGVFGAARTLSFGQSDPALIEGSRFFGGDQSAQETREILTGLRDAHPAANVGGEVVGAFVGPGKAKSLLGKVATTATPMGAATKLGSMAERAVLTGLPKSRMLSMGARGAVEGAMMEGGLAVSEASLGDHELTSEKVLAAMKSGAKYGGAFGGGLGLGARGLGGAANRLRKITESPSGEAGRSLTERIFGYATDAGSTAQAMLTGESASFLKRLNKPGKEGRAFRKMVHRDAEQIFDDAKIRMADDITQQNDDITWIIKRTVTDGKPEMMARMTDPSLANVAARELSPMVPKFANRINDVMAKESKGFWLQNSATKDLRDKSRHVLPKLQTAIREGNVAKMRTYAEAFKRDIDMATSSLKMVSGAKTPNARRTAEMLNNEFGDPMRKMLERRDMWGPAAKLQEDMNVILKRVVDNNKAFNRDFTIEGNTSYAHDQFIKAKYGDPSKVGKFVSKITNPEADLSLSAYRTRFEGERDLARVLLDQAEGLGAEEIKRLNRVVERSERALKELDEFIPKAAAINQTRALTQADSTGALFGGMIGGGIAAGEPLALGAAAILGPLTKPGRTSQQLTAIEQLVSEVNSRMGSSMRKTMARASANMSLRGGVTRAAVSQRKRKKDPIDDYNDIARSLERTQDATIRARARAELDPIVHGAPNTVRAAEDKAQNTRNYLLSQLPVPTTTTFLLGQLPVPSATELEEWRQKLDAVIDPTKLLDDLDKGQLSSNAIAAVKATSPELFKEMQQRALDQLAEIRAAGKSLPYSDELNLSKLLEIPLTPTLDPAYIMAVQASYGLSMKPPSQKSKRGKRRPSNTPELSRHHMTGSAQLEERDDK